MAYWPYRMEGFVVSFLVYQGVLWTMPHCSQAFEHFDDEDYISGKGRIARSSSGICNYGWHEFGDKCYIFLGTNFLDRKSWSDAKEHCERLYATLVSIHSKKEQDYLNSNIPPGSYGIWIGLQRLDDGAISRWVDGSPQDFNNWAAGQPNETYLARACVQMQTSTSKRGTWTDQRCNSRRSFICQSLKYSVANLLDQSSGDGEGTLCANGLCQNGGTCVDNAAFGNIQCICASGFKGQRCEESILCTDDVCGNGGTCVEDAQGVDFRCICPNGYRGERCKEEDPAPGVDVSNYIYIIGAMGAVVLLIIIVLVFIFIKRRRNRGELAKDSVAKPSENKTLSTSYCKRTHSQED